MKNILILSDLDKESKKIGSFLNSCKKYRAFVHSYNDDMEDIFSSNQFDFCILFSTVANHTPRTLVYELITKTNPTQKIIEIQNKDTGCFFNTTCQECLNRTYITLKKPINEESLMNALDNFDDNICQVLAKKDIINNLNHLHFFRHFTDKDILELKQYSFVKRYKKDNIIFYSGDKIDYFYLLLSGNVRQYTAQNDGNINIVKQFIAPSFICEEESYIHETFLLNLEATNDCSILYIDKEFFLRLLKHDNKLSFLMFNALSYKMMEFQKKTINNSYSNTDYKLALKLYERPCVLKYIKKSQLANELNIAPATLSRALRKLKESNILNNKNEIVDFNKLEKMIFEGE
jgi:CRP/FNR family transcriptional regulator